MVNTPYPLPVVLAAMPATGTVGGAGVQHAAFCSAVLLSTATAVVQDGSTCQGGTHATTRQTIRPTQAMFWLHWP